MKLKGVHQYEHDVDTVFANFTDAEAVKAKLEAIGGRKIEILFCGEKDGKHVIHVKREMPADVPGALKKFVGEWNSVEQVDSWEGAAGGPRKGRTKITVAGVPVSMAGAMLLKPAGAGCVNNILIEVKSSIPFVGKTLAGFAAGDTKKAMAAEYEFIKSQLAG